MVKNIYGQIFSQMKTVQPNNLNRDVKLLAFPRPLDLKIESTLRPSGSLSAGMGRFGKPRFEVRFLAIPSNGGNPVGRPARAPLKSGRGGRPPRKLGNPGGKPVGKAARAPFISGRGGRPPSTLGNPGGRPVGMAARAPEISGNPVGIAAKAPERSGMPAAKSGNPICELGRLLAIFDTPSTSPWLISLTPFIRSPEMRPPNLPVRSWAEFNKPSIIPGVLAWVAITMVVALVVAIVARVVGLVVLGGVVVITTNLRVDNAIVVALVVTTIAGLIVGFVVTTGLTVTVTDFTVGLVVTTAFSVVLICLLFLISGISAIAGS